MLTMLSSLFQNVLFFVLHVTGRDAFPKPLTPKEEQACLLQMRSENPAEAKLARDKLIEHNLRLVAHIIKKYYAASCDQGDLISIGTIGLMKAVDSFCPEKNIRLSSYAARCIENEILMYFRSMRKYAGDVSLNDPIETDSDGNALSLLDTLACEEDLVDMLDQKFKLREALRMIQQELPERERQILILRYGLIPGTRAMPQREVAKKLGISRSYVDRRHYYNEALKNLENRGFLKSDYLVVASNLL